MAEFYGYEGQERLSSSIEDVIEYFLEDEEYSDFPIKVYVFKPMDAVGDIENYSKDILEDILLSLDEDYGDPCGNYTEPTDAMEKASLELAKIIAKEYNVWSCEETGEVLEFSETEARKIFA